MGSAVSQALDNRALKKLRVAVIQSGNHAQVLRRTFNTREWEAYHDNARDISGALRSFGHNVTNFHDGREIISFLERSDVDIVWPCSGGIQGRNSAAHLPGILEMLGVEYVGSPPLAAATADHKPTAKIIAEHWGVETPPHQVLRSPLDPLDPHLDFPLVVKPSIGFCACGVYRVQFLEELRKRVESLIDRYHSAALVEAFIPGRDITVAVLEHDNRLTMMPPIERRFSWGDDLASFSAQEFRWGHSESTLAESEPLRPNLNQHIASLLETTSETIFHALGLRHFARLDYRLTGDERLYFLEANHKPDLTTRSLFAYSAAVKGMTYPDLIGTILGAALTPHTC